MDDRNGRPLDERVAALERTITDGYADDGLPDAARMETRLDNLEATVDDIDGRVAELDAAVQALRGFVGGVNAVDESVERRADAAVARVDRLETELEAVRETVTNRGDGAGSGRHAVAESNGREPAVTHGDDTRAGPRDSPHRQRAEPTVADERATNRGVGAGAERGRDGDRAFEGSLSGDVAARTDAALADAAAQTDDPDDTDDGGSLADRIRQLL